MITTLSRRTLLSGRELVLFNDGVKPLSFESAADFLGAVVGDGFVTFFNPPFAFPLPDSQGNDVESSLGFTRPQGLSPDFRLGMARRAFEGLGLTADSHPDVYFVRLQESELGPLDADLYAKTTAGCLEDEQFSISVERLWGSRPTGSHPATDLEGFSWKGLHAVADALALQFPTTRGGASITGNVRSEGDFTLFASRSKLFGSLTLPADGQGARSRTFEFNSLDTLSGIRKSSQAAPTHNGRKRISLEKGGATQVLNAKKAEDLHDQADNSLRYAKSRTQALCPFAAGRPEFVEMVDWLTKGFGETQKAINDPRLSAAAHMRLKAFATLSHAIAEALAGPGDVPGANGIAGIIAASAPPDFAVFAFCVEQAAKQCRDLVHESSSREIALREKEARRTLRIKKP